ncbi:glutathione S-transferase family protein [Hyalangium gracile]|uniref:glutathione S-transferase family protein n=1 Tax=Hyalangium gracile TaxID=394092 RepID=UPI00295E8580|nr:glutathione S-transferase family protein [Hyalangium gracile]
MTAFRWVPPFAQGLVRDHRVRWALEEAGLAYEERLIGPEDQRTESFLRQQPFGQVPVYEEDDLVLFESGAIVLHIAERSEALMPTEPRARARVKAWMFAALNSVEPHVMNYTSLDVFHGQEEWARLRKPSALAMAESRLSGVAKWLEGKEYLEDRFTAGDLLMTTVLRILRDTDVLKRMPVLEAYRLRCEARPAFQRSLAAQLAPFARNAPPAPKG